MRWIASLCGVVLLIAALPVQAQGVNRLSAQFVDFPQGSQCGVEDAFNPVRVSERGGQPRLLMIGLVQVGRMYCDLPDGRRVAIDVNKRLRPQTRAAGFLIYPNGRATMTTSVIGGLITDNFTGVIGPWE